MSETVGFTNHPGGPPKKSFETGYGTAIVSLLFPQLAEVVDVNTAAMGCGPLDDDSAGTLRAGVDRSHLLRAGRDAR